MNLTLRLPPKPIERVRPKDEKYATSTLRVIKIKLSRIIKDPAN